MGFSRLKQTCREAVCNLRSQEQDNVIRVMLITLFSLVTTLGPGAQLRRLAFRFDSLNSLTI